MTDGFKSQIKMAGNFFFRKCKQFKRHSILKKKCLIETDFRFNDEYNDDAITLYIGKNKAEGGRVGEGEREVFYDVIFPSIFSLT